MLYFFSFFFLLSYVFFFSETWAVFFRHFLLWFVKLLNNFTSNMTVAVIVDYNISACLDSFHRGSNIIIIIYNLFSHSGNFSYKLWWQNVVLSWEKNATFYIFSSLDCISRGTIQEQKWRDFERYCKICHWQIWKSYSILSF